jgi:hypothetical protein
MAPHLTGWVDFWHLGILVGRQSVKYAADGQYPWRSKLICCSHFLSFPTAQETRQPVN